MAIRASDTSSRMRMDFGESFPRPPPERARNSSTASNPKIRVTPAKGDNDLEWLKSEKKSNCEFAVVKRCGLCARIIYFSAAQFSWRDKLRNSPRNAFANPGAANLCR